MTEKPTHSKLSHATLAERGEQIALFRAELAGLDIKNNPDKIALARMLEAFVDATKAIALKENAQRRA